MEVIKHLLKYVKQELYVLFKSNIITYLKYWNNTYIPDGLIFFQYLICII